MKKNIYSLTLKELESYFLSKNEKKFRAKQVFKWLYEERVNDFSEMTNLSMDIRNLLSEEFDIKILLVDTIQKSKDRTHKYLFHLRDGHYIESVLMEHDYGYSVCVSSQVGCRMGCSFCASTLGGNIRNLECGEMVSQVVEIQKDLDKDHGRVSSIVLMGSGEPFDNFNEVMKFIELINNSNTLNIGARHITISTCGIVPKIYEFADLNLQVTLAISLHATTNETRSRIMPINKKYPIEDLIKSIEYYNKVTNRRVSLEFGLLNGVNDSKEEAMRLSQLIKHLLCHVNLIPINYVLETQYQKPKTERIKDFVKVLENNGVNVTLRREKGSDIDAACGQLRAKKAKLL